MTLADTDIVTLKEKINLLIDNVFIDEQFPYSGSEFVIDDTYRVKIHAILEENEEKIGIIRIVVKPI